MREEHRVNSVFIDVEYICYSSRLIKRLSALIKVGSGGKHTQKHVCVLGMCKPKRSVIRNVRSRRGYFRFAPCALLFYLILSGLCLEYLFNCPFGFFVVALADKAVRIDLIFPRKKPFTFGNVSIEDRDRLIYLGKTVFKLEPSCFAINSVKLKFLSVKLTVVLRYLNATQANELFDKLVKIFLWGKDRKPFHFAY